MGGTELKRPKPSREKNRPFSGSTALARNCGPWVFSPSRSTAHGTPWRNFSIKSIAIGPLSQNTSLPHIRSQHHLGYEYARLGKAGDFSMGRHVCRAEGYATHHPLYFIPWLHHPFCGALLLAGESLGYPFAVMASARQRLCDFLHDHPHRG